MNEAFRKWFDEHETALNVGFGIVFFGLTLNALAPRLFQDTTVHVVNAIVALLCSVALGAFFWSMYHALKDVPVGKAPAWRLVVLILLLVVALASPWWVPSMFGRLLHYS